MGRAAHVGRPALLRSFDFLRGRRKGSVLRKSAALLFCLCVASSVAGAASASPGIGSVPFSIGVTEDAPKGYDDGGLSMHNPMTGFGLTVDRLSVDWDAPQPPTVLEQATLARPIPPSTAGAVKVVI